MMRKFNCSQCNRTDTYSNPLDAFMDGWKMGEMGMVCPECRKKEPLGYNDV